MGAADPDLDSHRDRSSVVKSFHHVIPSASSCEGLVLSGLRLFTWYFRCQLLEHVYRFCVDRCWRFCFCWGAPELFYEL